MAFLKVVTSCNSSISNSPKFAFRRINPSFSIWVYTGFDISLGLPAHQRKAGRSNLILSLLKKTVVYHRPVLIVMKDTECEQITRWVNSLAFRFSDATWSDWTAVRTEYSLGKFETSYRIASGETQFSASGQGVLVASDDPLMIQTLRDQGEDFRGCLIEPNFVLTCD